MSSCHVCDATAVDTCNRCERPTCEEHFWDLEYLGLCEPCHTEVDEFARAGKLVAWPYPVNRVRPEWVDPDGPAPEVRQA